MGADRSAANRDAADVARIEAARGPVVGLARDYPEAAHVERHRHRRAQLLHALTGAVLVSTDLGRWMVPPDHAIWIPAGIDHSVDMLGAVSMRSIYVEPAAMAGPPARLGVLGMTRLMRSLVLEVVEQAEHDKDRERDRLLCALLLAELPRLSERPLALPIPADPRLAALCLDFMARPSARATIDRWARRAGMSRRSFTRAFQRQTGLSLQAWRQQAGLFAALPRLAEGAPVTAVAFDLGYSNVAAFSTMFRRRLGASPRHYLKSAAARASP